MNLYKNKNKIKKAQRWEVQELLKKRTNEDGSVSYLVRWKGNWPNTWQPAENCDRCPRLIARLEGTTLLFFLFKGQQKTKNKTKLKNSKQKNCKHKNTYKKKKKNFQKKKRKRKN